MALRSLIFRQGLSGGYMMRLAGGRIIYPVLVPSVKILQDKAAEGVGPLSAAYALLIP